MGETHKNTRTNEGTLDPSFRIFIPESPWMTKKIFIFYVEVEDMHSTECKQESDNWRKEERFKDFNRLFEGESDRMIGKIHDE